MSYTVKDVRALLERARSKNAECQEHILNLLDQLQHQLVQFDKVESKLPTNGTTLDPELASTLCTTIQQSIASVEAVAYPTPPTAK